MICPPPPLATLAQSGVLLGVTIKIHCDETLEQTTRAAKKQKVQDRKQQLAAEAKQVIAKPSLVLKQLFAFSF